MPHRSTKQSRDIYQEVTDRIVAALESGVTPWVRPWEASASFPRNGVTNRPYQGINVILLWMAATACGYHSEDWFTFKQAKQKGANVRKGERGTLVTFWKLLSLGESDAEDLAADRTEQIPLLRHFIVFNRDQLEGLPPEQDEQTTRPVWERDETVESFVRATGARIIERGAEASYMPALDEIHIPPLEVFTSREAYYATELHELTHWTGHPSRLNRDPAGRFGSQPYAREELVAEMGAAFLSAALGVETQLQHPEYIASWIMGLKEDKRAIFRAASEARQAAQYLGAIPPAGQMIEEGAKGADLAEAA